VIILCCRAAAKSLDKSADKVSAVPEPSRPSARFCQVGSSGTTLQQPCIVLSFSCQKYPSIVE